MANTYMPLQVAFIKESGKIGQIERMAPLSTREVKSNSAYRYALELNDGWFDNNKIGDNNNIMEKFTKKILKINNDKFKYFLPSSSTY